MPKELPHALACCLTSFLTGFQAQKKQTDEVVSTQRSHCSVRI